MPVCRPGALSMSRSITVRASTPAMLMETVSTKYTSTPWKAFGVCFAPGCDHTLASHSVFYRCTVSGNTAHHARSCPARVACRWPLSHARVSLSAVDADLHAPFLYFGMLAFMPSDQVHLIDLHRARQFRGGGRSHHPFPKLPGQLLGIIFIDAQLVCDLAVIRIPIESRAVCGLNPTGGSRKKYVLWEMDVQAALSRLYGNWTECVSQRFLPLYIGFFQAMHNVRQRGHSLLSPLLSLLLTSAP